MAEGYKVEEAWFSGDCGEPAWVRDLRSDYSMGIGGTFIRLICRGEIMTRRDILALGFVVLGLVTQASAADKADPTGT